MVSFLRKGHADKEKQRAEEQLKKARENRKRAEEVTSALLSEKRRNGYAEMVMKALGETR